MMDSISTNGLYPALQNFAAQAQNSFGQINPGRKEILHEVAEYIKQSLAKKGVCKLNFICVHNSRRSHYGQVWAQVAAAYYDIKGIEPFSGGTEVSALNPNAKAALQRAGVQIELKTNGENPLYEASIGNTLKPFELYSKLYDNVVNPQTRFAAVMVCGEGDEACPIVKGADKRFLTPYTDPKKFDGTPEQDTKYDETSQKIAREVFYVFSQINNNNG